MQPLTNNERSTLMQALDADGYFVLPRKLSPDTIAKTIAAMDRITDQVRGSENISVKKQNCVAMDKAFLDLVMLEPALQLAYDCFGPAFHLCQSNFVSRPNDGTGLENFLSAAPWHADGPRPGLFPRVNGAMGLHYLKFGYFLTDLTHGNGGSLQVVRGSHLRPERDGAKPSDFRIADYAKDLVQFDCEAGTVVAFHQAQWHAAPPNQSSIERKNVYISYCPTWMRPFDRELPDEESLYGLSPEERWILGEPRPAQRWWLLSSEDTQRMARFRRDTDAPVELRHYD